MWWAKVTGRKPSIQYVNATQSGLLADMERQKRLMEEASEEEVNRKAFREGLIREEKLTEVENANAELRKLTMEKRKVGLEELRVFDTSRVGLAERTVPGIHRSEDMLENEGSVNSARETHKKRREKSRPTRRSMSRVSDVEVDMDEHEEELSFIPIAVSSSAGWHDPKFMCDQALPETRSSVL